MPLACKANALPYELHPLTIKREASGTSGIRRRGRVKKLKNSPTGIRTPVFHVTGEDTNQLYYWRSLSNNQLKVPKVRREKNKERKKKGTNKEK